MSILEALGLFINYCNRNLGRDPRITNRTFEDGCERIKRSAGNRFYHCRTVNDVLEEIDFPN